MFIIVFCYSIFLVHSVIFPWEINASNLLKALQGKLSSPISIKNTCEHL